MAPMDMSAGRLVVASVWESYNQTRGSTHLAGGKPPCLHLQAEMTEVGGCSLSQLPDPSQHRSSFF